ncbi:hypothetical protein AQUCO_00201169v1 [Aquilegia coerulea]|uniref:Protein kinase domain-containing protein n=1 Tax=Aquilegia coerulea TaxID=218851 RepID=A0A2G5F6U4_AQUCA|nr:hypothetical protein AQUCO_00201169v1 [Aquilegia coerulea]
MDRFDYLLTPTRLLLTNRLKSLLCYQSNMEKLYLFFLLLLLLLLPTSHTSSSSSNPEVQALIAFKSANSPSSKSLESWKESMYVCTWRGVTCVGNHVSKLNLEGLGLSGSFEELTSLKKLSVLNLKRNQLSETIPDLSNFKELKVLSLAHNKFSGEFPVSILSLQKLLRLDLSYNNFSGPIPVKINCLTLLRRMKLERNHFSGSISHLNLPNLKSLNISSNRFIGEIPESLSSFPESTFHQNYLSSKGFIHSSPANFSTKRNLFLLVIVTTFAIIIIGGVYFSRAPESVMKDDLIFFERVERQFSLQELLSSPAVKLGNGGCVGSTYKTVLSNGDNIVAVKKLNKNLFTKEQHVFEQHVERLGSFQHDNIVSLQGYYYGEAKLLLLVYDYVDGDSLHWLLHGHRGPGRLLIDWPTRLRIAIGVALGLKFIHAQSQNVNFHGNLKSTNIVVDRAGNPSLVDYGLISILASTSMDTISKEYLAPEANAIQRFIDGRSGRYGDLTKWGYWRLGWLHLVEIEIAYVL